MRYGSLFSGIGGFDLAADRTGMECAWQVEIDPNCQDILARHWPEVERHGDVREVGARNLGAVDLVVGGFPCQDISVAGRREGLAGARGGLWWEFHRIVAELRPAWVVIENVPGLLSSNGGRDMGTILGALGDLGYGWAYRVLDAEWFGLAQRRRRVFIVGHLGDRRAAEVLLEPEGGGGNTPPGRETGTRVAANLTAGSHGPGVNQAGRRREDDENVVTQALTRTFGSGGADDTKAQAGFLVARSLTAPSSPRYDGDSDNFVVSHAPTAEGHDASEDGTGRGTPIIAVGLGSYPLTSEELAQPVTARNGDPGHVFASYGVRRLTPTECARLQGFPDDWCAVGASGKQMADSVQYRMLGNAVAVPVVEWILRRIARSEVAASV